MGMRNYLWRFLAIMAISMEVGAFLYAWGTGRLTFSAIFPIAELVWVPAFICFMAGREME